MISTLIKKIAPGIDLLIAPLVVIAGVILKFVRTIGFRHFPVCKRVLLKVGLFPIRDHYYEPLFHPKHIAKPLSDKRHLPGIDLNIEVQLGWLSKLNSSEEFMNLHTTENTGICFNPSNNQFGSGDAEYWYSLVRLIKPKKIIEIGSGNSTLLAIKALDKNVSTGHHCEHICIEPYEMPWLEQTNVSVLRKKVEDVDQSVFSKLSKNDILFIDSSHIIRPQGDVLTEFLEIIPNLNKGVIVHVHDIFTPYDYPSKWVLDDVRFWNEQYLLEAYLSNNDDFEVIGALNFLKNSYFDKFKEIAPNLDTHAEPGSFYFRKTT